MSLKTPLITALGAYNSKTAYFFISTFNKHDETRLLAKFKKILFTRDQMALNGGTLNLRWL